LTDRGGEVKTAIAGGVAPGASTGARLRRLDEPAEIVVLERDRRASFANLGLPYHIGGAIPDRGSLLHTLEKPPRPTPLSHSR
jgi:NADPH-dependent 2,4-dienoyl-CoA reductase/sulfur reductase-like enzyme